MPQPVDRVQQRQRVEPVVDATAPEQHVVVGADARDDAAERRRDVRGRLVLDAERHDGDQRAEIGAAA